MTQNCPGILQVEMRYLKDGQNVFNVFHVANNDLTDWDSTPIDAVESVFHTNYWIGSQSALLCADISLVEIVCTDLTSLAGLKQAYPITPAEAGSHTGGSLPNNATIAVKAAIGTRGRGTSGRIFWPGLPESEVTGNTLDSDYADGIVLALQTLKEDIDGLIAGFDLVVLSRRLNGTLRPSGIGRHIRDWVLTDTSVDSQKLRLPRHKKAKKPT